MRGICCSSVTQFLEHLSIIYQNVCNNLSFKLFLLVYQMSFIPQSSQSFLFSTLTQGSNFLLHVLCTWGQCTIVRCGICEKNDFLLFSGKMAVMKRGGKQTTSTFSGRYILGKGRNKIEDMKLIPLKLFMLCTTVYMGRGWLFQFVDFSSLLIEIFEQKGLENNRD